MDKAYEQCRQRMLQRQNDIQACSNGVVVQRLLAWVSSQASRADGSLARKVPVAWVYADGMHSVDMASLLADLKQQIGKAGRNAVQLTPSQLNSRQGSAKVAQDMFVQLNASGAAPAACTLQHVRELLQDQHKPPAARGDGQPAGAPLAVLMPDAEAMDPTRLQRLVLALSDARADGLHACLVIGLATSPALLLPRLPAEATGRLWSFTYKLESPISAMNGVMCQLQASDQLPEVLLGPRVLDHITHCFLNLDFTPGLLATHMRLALLQHFQAQPAAVLLPSFLASDWAQLLADIVALPDRVLASLWASIPLAEAGNPAKPHAKRDRQARAVAVHATLERLHWDIRTWHLALRWLHTVGGGDKQHAFCWRHLLTAASCPNYVVRRGGGLAQGDGVCRHLAGPGAHQLRRIWQDLAGLDDGAARAMAQRVLGTASAGAGALGLQGAVTELSAALEATPAAAVDAEQSMAHGSDMPGDGALADGGGLGAAAVPSEQAASPDKAAAASAADVSKRMRAAGSNKRARKQALAAFVNKQAEVAGAGVACATTPAAAEPGPPPPRTLGLKLAELVVGALADVLQRPPCSMPCAAVVCFDDVGALAPHLSPSPRVALHRALGDPAATIAQHGTPLAIKQAQAPGAAARVAKLPDACIAYRLLLHYGDLVDVGAWFASFCAVHGTGVQAKHAPPPRGKVSKSKQRKRRKLKTVDHDAPEADADEAGPVPDDVEQAMDDLAQGLDGTHGDAVCEAAARFCQAVADLEAMGFVKRNKRRAGLVMQRVMFHPDMGTS